jgi:hypothetical protein
MQDAFLGISFDESRFFNYREHTRTTYNRKVYI